MGIQHGRYGFEGGTALICRCGHTLAVHRPDEPHPCDLDAHLAEGCECAGFTPTHAPGQKTLRSVSTGAVYDDGPRGRMKMEVSRADGTYAALEFLDWPERRQVIEVGRAPTYEGAVELMWRHVVASAPRSR